jgi:regulator of ribosome biosynthesis
LLDPLAKLPKGTMPIPREKPVPVAQSMTKWEQYAKEKGIKKTKKSRLVFVIVLTFSN